MRATMMAAIGFFALSSSALAGFITLSYTEKVLTWDAQFQAIGAANNLSDAQLHSAKQVAAGWILIGPCETPNVDLKSHPAHYGLQVMADPNFKNHFHAAILQMVAVMMSENLGRKPPPEICRFASDISSSH